MNLDNYYLKLEKNKGLKNMIKKVLVVNCGEIVVCIICVVKEFGVEIVVIYLEVDKEVLYI